MQPIIFKLYRFRHRHLVRGSGARRRAASPSTEPPPLSRPRLCPGWPGWRAWIYATSAALLLSGRSLEAQSANQVEQLQRQLQQLQEEFQRQQALQRQQIEALQQQIKALQSTATNPPAPAKPEAQAAAAPPTAPAPSVPWSPSQPIKVAGGGGTYANLSLDGLFAAGASTAHDLEALEPGGHDPHERGFTVQNVEATLDGAVDPYLRGQANIVWQIDGHGQTTVELEEAYLTSVALPANLQLKAGQFFTEFGRLNATHPHTWTFADQPLINARLFGADGLRNPGARLSWLVPTPFYSELFFTVQNAQGGTAYSFRSDHDGKLLFGRPTTEGNMSALGDLLFTPRYATSFELSDNQTLVMGGSAAFGPNGSGDGKTTQIYGLDTYWKWKSAKAHGGFPFVSWQTEVMGRRYEAGAYNGLLDPAHPTPALPAETLFDYGMYSQLAYGFHLGWVLGLRGDWVGGEPAAFRPDPDRDTRWRISPNLTWFPSEFSKIRLQYNYDNRQNLGADHSVWMQFEFLLGAHAAHKF